MHGHAHHMILTLSFLGCPSVIRMDKGTKMSVLLQSNMPSEHHTKTRLLVKKVSDMELLLQILLGSLFIDNVLNNINIVIIENRVILVTITST